jgi:hypothetical protein
MPNLITHPYEFDDASWTKAGVSVNANDTTAPDGSATADRLTASAGAAQHIVFSGNLVTTESVAYVVSVYVKAGTAQFVMLTGSGVVTNDLWYSATVDLSNGTVTETTDGASASSTAGAIQSVGGGWYWIQVSGTHADDESFLAIDIVDTGTPTHGAYNVYSWDAAGTETIYLWGAQLELGTTATPLFTATTALPMGQTIL